MYALSTAYGGVGVAGWGQVWKSRSQYAVPGGSDDRKHGSLRRRAGDGEAFKQEEVQLGNPKTPTRRYYGDWGGRSNAADLG